jgi:FkbM family methyltransferase
VKLVHGWFFPLEDEFMCSQLPPDGGYQRAHLDAALRHVKAWRVAIDGGAHVGTWARPMAKRFGEVLAFEPSPDTFECLAKNLHGISNVTLFNAALGKEPGAVTMTLDGFERAVEIKNTGARFVKEGGTVPRLTIDSLELQALDFLKMDIEGGEVDALFGARETLRKFKPTVLFEDKWHWKRYGYNRRAPHDLLTSLGAVHLERVAMDEIWGWA